MKKTFLIIAFSIILGIVFTQNVLNKKILAKEEYMAYILEAGEYQEEEDAKELLKNMPSGIIIKEDNLFKVYTGIYKTVEILNKMVVYFENNNININLKAINTTKEFSNILNNYEKILASTTSYEVYDKVNQAILDNYKESI